MHHPALTLAWAHMGPCWAQVRSWAQRLRCLRQTSKNRLLEKTTCHVPWNLQFCMFQTLSIELCKYGIPTRSDCDYKNRIKILYKKLCCTAPTLYSRADFFGNYCNYRTLSSASTQITLAWMSLSAALCVHYLRTICALVAHYSATVCWK